MTGLLPLDLSSMLVTEGASMDSFINLYLASNDGGTDSTSGRDSLRDLVESSLPNFEQELQPLTPVTPVTSVPSSEAKYSQAMLPTEQQPWQQWNGGLTVQYQKPVEVQHPQRYPGSSLPATPLKYHQKIPPQPTHTSTIVGWTHPTFPPHHNQTTSPHIQNLLKTQTPVANPATSPSWLSSETPPHLVADPLISEIGDEVLSHILGLPVKSEERKNVLVVANPSRGLFRDGGLTGQQPVGAKAVPDFLPADVPGLRALIPVTGNRAGGG